MADRNRIYEDVLDVVEDEIDKIVKKEDFDDRCLEYLYKLTDIAKDSETIMAMRDEYVDDSGYSQRGNSYRMSGNSYRGNGRYSSNYGYRNGGYMGGYGYSRDGSDMRSKLEHMMNEASTEHEREVIRRTLEQM